MREHRYLNGLLVVIPLVLVLAAWELIGGSSHRMSFLYGTPTAILSTLVSELCRAEFWRNILVTAGEVVGGLLIGNLFGTAFGLLLWTFPRVARISIPYVTALSAIPVFAIVPFFILWFGIGFSTKLAIIAFATMFVALASSFKAAVWVSNEYQELVIALGGSRSKLLKKVVMPGAVALSFTAYRMNISFSLVGAYVAEWVSAERGLGQYVYRALGLYDLPRVWAGLLMFLAIGFILHAVTNFIEKRFFKTTQNR